MATPLVKFYYDLMSPPARALFTFFRMAKVPFEPVSVKLRQQEHKTEEYKKNVSKFGLVPVLHDGDFRLTESVAILRYIVSKNKVEDFWYPADPKERARVDEYLEWAHSNLRLSAAMAFFTKFRDPTFTGKAPSEEKVKRVDKQLQKTLNDFEALWMESPFIAGNKFTFADVQASCDLEQTRMTGIDPLVGRPKLAAWFKRTRDQLEPLFTEHHKFVYVVEEMIQKQGFPHATK